LKEVRPEEGVIIIDKRITRPANERLFPRGPREAVEIIKPFEDMSVKEPQEVIETKEPIEVKQGDTDYDKEQRVVPQELELTVGVTVIRRPVKRRTKVLRDGGQPVAVVMLGKRMQVRPKTGKMFQCADGFQLQPKQKGKRAKCLRQCTVSSCYKTVHRCRDGYEFNAKTGNCIQSKIECTAGYQMKKTGSEQKCVKEIPDCEDGYHLDKSGDRPICSKSALYCSEEYLLRERDSEKVCVRKVYSCTENFELKTKNGKKVCSIKENGKQCYRLMGQGQKGKIVRRFYQKESMQSLMRIRRVEEGMYVVIHPGAEL
jgi:hypothetical protein